MDVPYVQLNFVYDTLKDLTQLHYKKVADQSLDRVGTSASQLKRKYDLYRRNNVNENESQPDTTAPANKSTDVSGTIVSRPVSVVKAEAVDNPEVVSATAPVLRPSSRAMSVVTVSSEDESAAPVMNTLNLPLTNAQNGQQTQTSTVALTVLDEISSRANNNVCISERVNLQSPNKEGSTGRPSLLITSSSAESVLRRNVDGVSTMVVPVMTAPMVSPITPPSENSLAMMANTVRQLVPVERSINAEALPIISVPSSMEAHSRLVAGSSLSNPQPSVASTTQHSRAMYIQNSAAFNNGARQPVTTQALVQLANANVSYSAPNLGVQQNLSPEQMAILHQQMQFQQHQQLQRQQQQQQQQQQRDVGRYMQPLPVHQQTLLNFQPQLLPSIVHHPAVYHGMPSTFSGVMLAPLMQQQQQQQQQQKHHHHHQQQVYQNSIQHQPQVGSRHVLQLRQPYIRIRKYDRQPPQTIVLNFTIDDFAENIREDNKHTIVDKGSVFRILEKENAEKYSLVAEYAVQEPNMTLPADLRLDNISPGTHHYAINMLLRIPNSSTHEIRGAFIEVK